MKITVAKFKSDGQDYDYFTQPGDDPQLGDFIITSYEEKLNGTNGRFMINDPKIAQVTDTFSALMPNRATKPYLLLIQSEFLRGRKAERDILMQHAREQAEAKAALKEMLSRRSETEMFERMAAENPEAARLLAIVRKPVYAMLEATPNSWETAPETPPSLPETTEEHFRKL